MSPRITFACELDTADLTQLLADGTVVADLAALQASVSLAIIDLSDERALAVKKLMGAGLAVTAWLLLPMDQGYWFNVNNAALALPRYQAFREWSLWHGLAWAGVGLDVEPDTREIKAALANRWTLAPLLLRRLFNDTARRGASAAYADLITLIRADGYRVESYVFPFLEDERVAGSTLLSRILGVVRLDVDTEIPMLYTSLMGRLGVGFLWSYGRGKPVVLVGSTGGGPLEDIEGSAHLNWEQLSRDLRLASKITQTIGVYSLEGCVTQGFLERLRDFDWNGTVDVPQKELAAVERMRVLLRGALWLAARPALLLGLVGLLLAGRALRQRLGPMSQMQHERESSDIVV